MIGAIDRKILIQIKTEIFKLKDLNKYRFFLFDSRVDGTSKEKSDYDIGVIGRNKNINIDSDTKLSLEESFEDIPALIDFVDFSEVSEDFKKQAMKNVLWLNK